MFHRLIPAAIGLCVVAGPAAAQPRCLDYHALLADAAARYGEQPVSLALSARGHAVVTLANPRSGTWTLLVRRADGCTRAVDHGEAWTAIDPPDRNPPNLDPSQSGEPS